MFEGTIYCTMYMTLNLYSQEGELRKNSSEGPNLDRAGADKMLAAAQRELEEVKRGREEERDNYNKQIEALKKEVEAQRAQVSCFL